MRTRARPGRGGPHTRTLLQPRCRPVPITFRTDFTVTLRPPTLESAAAGNATQRPDQMFRCRAGAPAARPPGVTGRSAERPCRRGATHALSTPHAHSRAHPHPHTYSRTHTHAQTHTHTLTHARTHTHTHTHTHARTRTHTPTGKRSHATCLRRSRWSRRSVRPSPGRAVGLRARR